MHYVLSIWHLIILVLAAIGLYAITRVWPHGGGNGAGAPEGRKRYRPSMRDGFLIGGLLAGGAAYCLLSRQIYPAPPSLAFLPLLTMLAGLAVGEAVKRKRAGSATPR